MLSNLHFNFKQLVNINLPEPRNPLIPWPKRQYPVTKEFWHLQAAFWSFTAIWSLLIGSRFSLDLFHLVLAALMRGFSGFVFSTWILRPLLWKLLAAQCGFLQIVCQVSIVCGLITFVENTLFLSLFSFYAQPEQAVMTTDLIKNFIPIRIAAYLVWCGGYIAIHQWILRCENEFRIARAEGAAAKAELEMLRAQVDPHFIFNALNSVLAVIGNPDQASSMLQALCRHLRHTCETSRENHTLSEELKAVKNYIDIEQFRFEDGLQFSCSIDSASLAIYVPAGCLLIPVENAIKHGSATSPRPLIVMVNAQRIGDELKLTITNSGSWRNLNPDHHSVGMKNLTDILSKLFGELASVSVVEVDGNVIVNLTLPAV